MIAALYMYPLLLGLLLFAVGLRTKERWLRASGGVILSLGLILMVYQFYMIADHASWIEHGLFLHDWQDYAGFIGISLAAGLLTGDALVQVLAKKSSSS